MPMLGYAEFAGREVINTNRAAAYSAVGIHCGCNTLPAMLGEQYTNPAHDPAPWYDHAAPESAEFWGIVGMEIHGASQSTLATPFTDLVGDGAVPGSPRRAAREVEFKVMLIAASEAGLSWGITWLSAALRGSQCKTTCLGDTLCLLSGCPDPPPVNHRALCDPQPRSHHTRRPAHPARPHETTTATPPPKPAPPPAQPPPSAPPGPPPTNTPGPPDPETAKTIYLVGKELGVNDKVMLSAFETALAETNCRNIDHGDADSVGVFQQRPSQGWGNRDECLNVNHAAHAYFSHAIDADRRNPQFTPGQLAQAVQRSAHPERYDQKQPDAQKLLDDTQRATQQPPPPAPPPPQPTPSPAVQHPIPHSPADHDEPWTPRRAGQQLLRQLYDCALLEFASDEQRQRIQGAWTAQLTFTIKAGRPGWYTHPVTAIDSRHAELNPPVVQDVLHAYRIDQPAPCPQPPDCLEGNPYATIHGPWGPEPFPGSDPHDPVFRDPCYPTDPFDAQRAVYATPGDVTSTWLQKVPVITVYTGGADMHRVTIRFYANPRNRTPAPNLDPCDACTEITVPWIPAHTRLTLDGRTQRTTVRCPNQRSRDANITLYGPLGSVLQWPEFDCGTPMIVEMLAKVGTIAPDAWWRFAWSSKADAI